MPFSVDLLGDFLNCDFYTLHNHTESHKKSRTRIILSTFRKVFRRNMFENIFGKISEKNEILKIVQNRNSKTFEFWNFGNFRFWNHFRKCSENSPKHFRKYFLGKLFEILKTYVLFGIFFVIRYGYPVCKNHNLGNLQASQ